jgi:hypothetical protein
MRATKPPPLETPRGVDAAGVDARALLGAGDAGPDSREIVGLLGAIERPEMVARRAGVEHGEALAVGTARDVEEARHHRARLTRGMGEDEQRARAALRRDVQHREVVEADVAGVRACRGDLVDRGGHAPRRRRRRAAARRQAERAQRRREHCRPHRPRC